MQHGSAWRAAAITLVLLAISGCAPAPAPVPAATVLSPDDYGALKSSYLAANPDARLGKVAAVLAGEKRVSVEDMPVTDFRQGDVVSIVDQKLNPIADGTVEETDADYLYVNYVPAPGAARPPAVGDLVIRAESPPRGQ